MQPTESESSTCVTTMPSCNTTYQNAQNKMSWYAAGITKCSPQKNKSLLSLSNNLLNNIGIKNDLHTNRISEILCGQSFIIDTILNSIQATLLSVLLSSVLQWDCGWQVLCAVWFSFTDVQFSLSRSSLCTSNSHVSPLPPLSPPLSFSLLIWWKSMAPLFCGRPDVC